MSRGDEPRVWAASDEEHTKVLEANGYRVPRFCVLEDILSATTTTPTPNPSPQGGGEHTECVAAAGGYGFT